MNSVNNSHQFLPNIKKNLSKNSLMKINNNSYSTLNNSDDFDENEI